MSRWIFLKSRFFNKVIVRLFLVGNFIASGQASFAQEISFKRFTTDDGLASSTIYSVFQDNKGFLWFASDKGVSRYNGYSFTNYTVEEGLADNEVFEFFQDSMGRIWFCSLNGKVSYYQDGKIYNAENTPSLRDLNSSSYMSSIFEDTKQQVWISFYRDGIASYSASGTVRWFFTKNELIAVNKIFPIDSVSMGIIARRDVCTAKFNSEHGGIETTFDLNFSLDSLLNKSKAVKIGNEFFFTDRIAVYRGNLITGEYSTVYVDGDSEVVNNICADGRNLWICTDKGVFYLSNYTAPQCCNKILRDYKISSVLTDSEGNVWIGTLGEGVFFHSQNVVYTYPVHKAVTCLAMDSSKSVWWGSTDGMVGRISRGDGLTFSVTAQGSMDRFKRINSIAFIGSQILAGTGYGIFKLKEREMEFLPGSVKDAVEYPTGGIWAVYDNFLISLPKQAYEQHRYKIKAFKGYLDRQTGLGDMDTYDERIVIKERINSVHHNAYRHLWASTDKTLFKVACDAGKIVKKIPLNANVRVNDIYEMPDGNVVLATLGSGINVLSHEGEILCAITTQQGLSSDFCTTVTADDDNNLWVGTNKGINKVIGFPQTIHVTSLDADDGLLSNDISDILVTKDTVWVASKKGVNFLRKHTSLPIVNKPVYIRSFAVMGDDVVINDDYTGDLSLKYFQNNINVSFVYLSYFSHAQILYRYRLSAESEWRYTMNTELELASLAPGDYHLQIEAKDKTGLWSRPATVQFTIAKPFWKTRAFVLAIFGVSSLLVWRGMLYYFDKRKKELEKENLLIMSELRTLRAQINPHFFFNVLNAIQGMMFKNEPETTHTYLSKFSRLVRLMLDHSDKNYITLSDELLSITNYLQLEQLRMKNTFDFFIDVDPALDSQNTEVPVMMLQPFIENSIEHGFRHKVGKGHLYINFNKENDYLAIRISDDGVGRERSRQLRTKWSESKGIGLIQRRIETLNAQKRRKIELTIQDLEGSAGTCVLLKIPIE